MTCTHCGYLNLETASHCAQCGKALPVPAGVAPTKSCGACGAANDLEAAFCKKCGAALATTRPAERKSATPAVVGAVAAGVAALALAAYLIVDNSRDEREAVAQSSTTVRQARPVVTNPAPDVTARVDTLHTCRENLRVIWSALTQYLAANGRMPGANWRAELSAYQPQVADLSCPEHPGVVYIYNANLTGADLNRIADRAGTVVFYEGVPAEDVPSTTDTGQAWPATGVHAGATNVLLANGVVQTVTSRAEIESPGTEAAWAGYLSRPPVGEPAYERPQFDPTGR